MRIDVRLAVGVLIVAGLGVAGYWFWNSPERQIRKTLSKVVTAFEAEDIDGTIAHFSLKYRDDMGLAYLNIKQLMKQGFEEFEGFDVLLSIRDFKIADNAAVVFADFRLIIEAQGQKAYIIGSHDNPIPIEFRFAKEILKWKILAVNGIRVPYLDF